MSFFSKIFGDPHKKELKELQLLVEEINNLESKFKSFSGKDFINQTEKFKKRLKAGESLNDILPEAFALVRKASSVVLKQRHFDVQLMGGIVLHQGKIVEMKTGEGKTLAATLPLYLNALSEKGCHLVTVNDYLAKRDTVWMGQIYHALGLSVGCIVHDAAFIYDPEYQVKSDNSETEAEGDNRDKERDLIGGFKVVESYLRPCSRKEVYDADIIYGTNNEYGFDYLRDNMAIREDGITQRGFNFAIVDEVDSILIDEARTPLIVSMPDKGSTDEYKEFASIVPSLKENIDFDIDEKMKAVSLTEKGIEKVEGFLGKGRLYEGSEIRLIHHLEQAARAQFLFKKDRDYVVKDGEVIIVDGFTGRLLQGRRFSEGLHQAIEAKEGVDIKQESRTLASVTFQNYFRMYKKLSGMTGTAVTSAEEFSKVYNLDAMVIPTNLPMVREDTQDKIYKTQDAKFKAVVEEIKICHNKGQPVLVGTTSIEKNEYLGKLLEREGIPHQILNAKHHEREGEIIAQAGKLGAVTIATNMAGRGVDIILGGNPPDNKKAEEVKKRGGLHVIGTERHEARRIDNQLRGRAGRQGDSGSSRFFVSWGDDIVRVFGGEKTKKMLDILNFPDDMPIENKMISRAIENTQIKVEGYNFDARKHLLDFDDVLNKQRQKIYGKRREILTEKDNEKIKKEALEIVKSQIARVSDFHTNSNYCSDWDLKEILEQAKTIFSINDEDSQKILKIVESKKEAQTLRQEIKDNLFRLFEKAFQFKEAEIGENFNGVVKMIELKALDILWMEHLENMEALRDSVRLRAYGQIDPLIAYRTEGHKMFKELLLNFERQVANTILKIRSVVREQDQAVEKEYIKPGASVSDKSFAQKPAKGKVGRNDPCPCGSGKKYKKCCWPKFG